jgi:hypothetical protein
MAQSHGSFFGTTTLRISGGTDGLGILNVIAR